MSHSPVSHQRPTHTFTKTTTGGSTVPALHLSDSASASAPVSSSTQSTPASALTSSSDHTHRQAQVLSIVHRIQDTRCCGVGLCSGFEKVVQGGSASSSVKCCGLKPPQYFWYMVSGTLCDVIQLFIDLLAKWYIVPDPSICWAISFFCSIYFRHTSHRYFVFGDYVGSYWTSLMKMYTSYSLIVFLSTMFNMLMIRQYEIRHYVAWCVTLIWTGIVNYLILKKIWSAGDDDDKGSYSLRGRRGIGRGKGKKEHEGGDDDDDGNNDEDAFLLKITSNNNNMNTVDMVEQGLAEEEVMIGEKKELGGNRSRIQSY